MCEDCGFDGGVHDTGCWSTMTEQERQETLLARGWPPLPKIATN